MALSRVLNEAIVSCNVMVMGYTKMGNLVAEKNRKEKEKERNLFDEICPKRMSYLGLL